MRLNRDNKRLHHASDCFYVVQRLSFFSFEYDSTDFRNVSIGKGLNFGIDR